MPLLSVIIATHNRSGLLPRAVKSALRAGDDVEVIVVDDASSDDTAEICRQLVGIRVLRLEQNVGLAGARNAGIEISSGHYITFLDDDDLRLPGSLPEQVAALEKTPAAAFCYGQVFHGDNDCQPVGHARPAECPEGDLFWRLLRQNFIPVNSVVVRRDRLLELGLFDTTLRMIEDWDLWIRLSERWPAVAVPKPVGIYRSFHRSSGQLSSNRAAMASASAQVQARGLALPRALEAPAEQRTKLRDEFMRMTWKSLLRESINALLHGEVKEGRANLLSALTLQPSASVRHSIFRRLVLLAWIPHRHGRRPRREKLKQLQLRLRDS